MTITRTAPLVSERPAARHRFRAAMLGEQRTALATPAARLLLAMSVLMATLSTVANLSAVDDLTSDDTLKLAMHASTVATLIFAMLAGLYSATTDFRFGLIDQRLLSEPSRLLTLAAKSLVAGTIGLLYGALGAVTAVVAASGFFATQGESFDTGSPLVRDALIGVIIAAPLFAMLGVAIGVVVRNQPIAIGGSLAWLLIVEPVFLIGAPDVGRWFPGAAGIALTNDPQANLTQPAAALLLAGYCCAALALAAARFTKSDV